MKQYRLTRPMHEENIVIASNSDRLLTQLKLFHGSYLTPADDEPTITVTEHGDDAVILYPEGEFRCDDAMVFLSEYLFDHTVIRVGFFAMHAAAVAYGNRAWLVAAPTTTGKTTLTAYLVRNGFGYMTDDCALVEKDAMLVHPYAKPLHLREGGLMVLAELGIELPVSRIHRRHFDRFVWTPAEPIREPLPLGGIFFLERGDADKVEALSQSEAMTALMASPITHCKVNTAYLSFLKRLAGYGCRKLCYKNMEYVAESIRERAEQG